MMPNYQRELIYQQLITQSQGLPNDKFYACMLATWYSGTGHMPARLGLEIKAYERLLTRHFPQVVLPPLGEIKSISDLTRRPEQEDLRALLLSYCTLTGEEAEWITEIVVQGCMGNDHLWQDLGLWSRSDLSALMQTNFPKLAAKNDRDMKWKKFIYKQLCLQEGIYTCRAPSCEVCIDYQKCFGSEEE